MIWDGFLQNIGVVLTAFILSGGYLVAINKLKDFQSTVRSVPSDYFLTPLVLLLILFIVLIKVNRRQQEQLSKLTQEPEKGGSSSRLVTHLGVWWKVYPENEYIEDFPYCSCCDPNLKLVQTEWYPNEIFKCSKTNTEYKLYDKVPREREKVLGSLYKAYFKGLSNQIRNEYMAEMRRIKELNSDISNIDLTKMLFAMEPFSFIPNKEQEKIFSKNSDPMLAYHFVDRHYDSYKKFFKQKKAKNNIKKSPDDHLSI